MGAHKSVILVTVDCLRADHLGFMGYERPTTPFLDSLARESFVFPAAIVGGAPTYYSFPAIMASRFPMALGRDQMGIAPDEPSLASVLKQAGYATGAFSAGNPYISPRLGYDQGFDTFRDFLDAGPTKPSGGGSISSGNTLASRLNRKIQVVRPLLGPLGAVYDELYFQYCQRLGSPAVNSLDALRRFPAADVIVDQARSWLASAGGGPFFLWLHLMDPHGPYYPTEKALQLVGQPPVTPFRARYLNSFWNRSDLGPAQLERHREDILNLYDAGVRWVDAQMARFVEALKRLNLWDNCIFALTADHGEEFLDHGGRFHPPSRLMEELIHVPLLLRVPGAAKREISKAPFSLMNLAPTLLSAAQVPTPRTFHGNSWWNALCDGRTPDEPVFAESVAGCTNPFRPDGRRGSRVLVVRERQFKLMLRFETGDVALYDLEADPHESSPLPANAERATRRRLLQLAREHIQRSVSERDLGMRLSAQLRELRLEWALPSPQHSVA